MGFVSTQPDSVERNLIQPADDADKGLHIIGHSPTHGAELLQVSDDGGIDPLTVSDSRNTSAPSVQVQGESVNHAALLVFSPPGQTDLTGAGRYVDVFQVDANNTRESGLSFMCRGSIVAGSKGVNILLWGKTNTSFEDCGAIVGDFADDNDATYKGRVLFLADDFNGAREVLRIEADGAAGRFGAFGAPAVVKQVGASAAAIAAIIDPNAKAAVSALQTALANLGWVTSPA